VLDICKRFAVTPPVAAVGAGSCKLFEVLLPWVLDLCKFFAVALPVAAVGAGSCNLFEVLLPWVLDLCKLFEVTPPVVAVGAGLFVCSFSLRCLQGCLVVRVKIAKHKCVLALSSPFAGISQTAGGGE
jgi:hypothetical protein